MADLRVNNERQVTQQTERTSHTIGYPVGLEDRPGPLRKNLRFAGNPAVMALRFRPVVLRPRLSAGLPLGSVQNMPNKRRPHKRSVPKPDVSSGIDPHKGGAQRPRSLRTRAHLASLPRHSGSQSHSTYSVKDLLARSVPILSQAADQKARQAFWRPWLEARLPPELPAKITGITERNGSLVVFADSPAWSARLRYALQELTAQIRQAQPDIREVTVRVLPRAGQ
jgi:Dna[CI] antecedent, DciA